MNRARSILAIVLCLVSPASAYANLHGIVSEPQDLPSLHPAGAALGQPHGSSGQRPLLAKSNRFFRLGVEALHANRYADAIADFSMVLSLRKSTAALVNRGLAYRQAGDEQAAVANYTEALAFEPRSTAAFLGRGNAYALLGRYPQAIADYNSALSLQADNVDAYVGRANVWVQLKQYEQAGDDHLIAARLISTSPDMYRIAGKSYAVAKQYKKAISAYSEALRIAPTDVTSHVWRARAYRALGDSTAALADCEAAIRITPDRTDAYWERGLVLESLGNHEAAAETYKALERLIPNSGRPHTYRADELRDVGRDEEAGLEYEAAAHLSSDDEQLLYGRTEYWFYQGEYAAVISDADRWIQLNSARAQSQDDKHDLSYILIWRHMAADRLGIDDRVSLAAAVRAIDPHEWPRPIIDFYIGLIDETRLRALARSSDESTTAARQCELSTYLGESTAAHGRRDDAKRKFIQALRLCPANFIERTLARRSLEKLEALPASP